jgi:hypothetical protein
VPYQQIFVAAVASKTNVPAEFMNVTQKSICRPSNGEGRAEDIQRTYYSGYFRKVQGAVTDVPYSNGKQFLFCIPFLSMN